jgi:hypothetical protein
MSIEQKRLDRVFLQWSETIQLQAMDDALGPRLPVALDIPYYSLRSDDHLGTLCRQLELDMHGIADVADRFRRCKRQSS